MNDKLCCLLLNKWPFTSGEPNLKYYKPNDRLYIIVYCLGWGY